MKKIITGIGLLLLVTGCSKESIQPQCDTLMNNNVSIFSIQGNNTGEWRYVSYYDLDSNITALDKFMSSYTLYLDECPDIYFTPTSDCATNEDFWWFWNWNIDYQGNSSPIWMAQPDLEIISQQEYIPWFQDAWSPIGQSEFFLTPHDLTISINNGDSIIFY